jgi:aerobic carbon-monoxide dehydrogenase medium subunit
MYAFEYQRAQDVAAAVKAIKASGGKALAGGQSLLGAMKLRLAQPGTLVDLGRINGLAGIKVDAANVTIGATTHHADVAASAEVQSAIPALAQLAGHIGDRQVRNRGTIGGSLANNDPAACYPAAVLGLGATIITDRREIAADAFFTGMYETALAEDELITAVRFPRPKRAAYLKFMNPASRFALVGVFVAETSGGVRVAVTGAASCVFRSQELEAALNKSLTPAAAKAVKLSADEFNGDLHATPEYRAHLIPVLTARAVAALR